MRTILTVAIVLAMSMLAVVGCKAEGEIGDTQSGIAAPR
jgi:hypothetical protein